MSISENLKVNLIADVENILCINISPENKEMLMRCFEITIGTHIPESQIEKGTNQ